MITVLLLSFNRPAAVKSSIEALSVSLKKSKQAYTIHLFDDGSKIENYEKIKKTCVDLFDGGCVTFHRTLENFGYNANLIRAIRFTKTLTLDEDSVIYIHESDMIVSSNWIWKLIDILTQCPDLVVTPVHLTDHLFPEYQRLLVNKALSKHRLYLPKRQRSSTLKRSKLKVLGCYGTIGTLAFKRGFHKKLAENENVLSDLVGSEDAFLSYLADENLVYTFPGQSRIHPSPGLHGNMESSVASFQKFSLYNLFKIFITTIFRISFYKCKALLK